MPSLLTEFLCSVFFQKLVPIQTMIFTPFSNLPEMLISEISLFSPCAQSFPKPEKIIQLQLLKTVHATHPYGLKLIIRVQLFWLIQKVKRIRLGELYDMLYLAQP